MRRRWSWGEARWVGWWGVLIGGGGGFCARVWVVGARAGGCRREGCAGGRACCGGAALVARAAMVARGAGVGVGVGEGVGRVVAGQGVVVRVALARG